MIKGIDRVPIVSLYSLFQYSKRFHFALSFLSWKLYYIQFFPSYSHITCSFLAIKITALQPSTPFFFLFFLFLFFFSTNHEKRLFSFSSIFDIRFVSFPVAPLISRLIFVLQNFGFSFQWRNCQLLLDLNNGRLCAAIVVFTEFLLLRFRLIFPEFFRSERIFSRESLHVSYNF